MTDDDCRVVGRDLAEVRVIDPEDSTFYAELVLARAGGPIVHSARPSDAVAVGVRAGAPIWVADSLLDAPAQLAARS